MKSLLLSDPMRVSDWGQLHLKLVWAYTGKPETPAGLFCAHPIAAWRLHKGSVAVRGASRVYTAGPGQWMILPSLAESYEFSPGARITSVRFRAEWLDGRQLFEPAEPLVCDARSHVTLDRAARAVVRWVRKHLGPTTDALAEQKVGMVPYLHLAEITGRWVEAFATAMVRAGFEANRAGPVDARVLQVYRQLSTHPLHEPAPLSDLAARNGLGRKHLERLFCAYTGTSMRAFYDRRRLEQAQRMLTHSRQPIKEIGFQLGFRQMSHFSTWFRRQSGRYPLVFRAASPVDSIRPNVQKG